MAELRKLPDFICLGTPRSGTTWLYENLRLHPDIFLAPKELHFFSGRGDRDYYVTHGYEWYKEFYNGANPDQVKGEIAIHYFHSKIARERILCDMPNVKLIVMLRNPIDRIKSMYEVLYGRGEFRGNFAEFLGDWRGKNQLKTGCYAEILARWEESFPNVGVWPIFLDDVQSDQNSVYRDLCRFLGVREDFVPEQIQKKINEPRAVRSKFIRELYTKSALYISHKKLFGLRKVLRMSRIPYLIHKVNDYSEYRHDLSKHESNFLRNFYKKDIMMLEKKFDRDLSDWLRQRPESGRQAGTRRGEVL